MKFNNIERNILYLLSNEYLKLGILGPFDAKLIFDKFPDIPDKNIKCALQLVDRRGLVDLTSNYRTLSLTQKGLSKIRVLNLPGKGKLPYPEQL